MSRIGSGTVREEVKVEEVDREALWTIYHLSNPGGFPVRYETVRVGRYNHAGDYRVERLVGGWQHLLSGRTVEDSIEWVSEGLDRAIKVLYR